MSKERPRLAILVGDSSGSTAKHMVLESYAGNLEVDIACILAVGKYPGIEIAQKLGVSNRVLDRERFIEEDGSIDNDAFGEHLIEVADSYGATDLSQNGWDIYTPENVLKRFPTKNQHGGPLPETKNTKGIQPFATMLNFSNSVTRNEGTDVLIHEATPVVDGGRVVAVTHVPILENDTPESLQKRGKKAERALQIEYWNAYARGEVIPVTQHIYMRAGEEKILSKARIFSRREYPKG